MFLYKVIIAKKNENTTSNIKVALFFLTKISKVHRDFGISCLGPTVSNY